MHRRPKKGLMLHMELRMYMNKYLGVGTLTEGEPSGFTSVVGALQALCQAGFSKRAVGASGLFGSDPREPQQD